MGSSEISIPDRSRDRLILVDAMGALYRAFYAIPSLSTRSGTPTNAVFGFIRMLREVRETWLPTHWAVVFDAGLPCERLALLPEYKAQRAPMPDALRAQIPVAQDYLDRAGVRSLRQEGQEADDVMASVAVWAEHLGAEVLIASTDKDLYQMVNRNIRMIGAFGKVAAVGPDEVKVKTGVGPERVVEWLAMVGDAVDNIPGVPGIGPKTAAGLLAQYGSIDGVLTHLEGLKGVKVRESLRQHSDRLLKNVRMIRLRQDLPVPADWESLRVLEMDPVRVLPLLESLEFDSMARELRQPDLFGGLSG